MLRVAVQDANILIDLELAGLFDLWLQMGVETHTTDLIRAQLRRGGHTVAQAYIASGQVCCHELAIEDLAEVAALMNEVPVGPDLGDCSVLWLSEKIDCMMLTGDAALRKAGSKRSIEVHGTLWILDRLVERKLLTGVIAASKIENLLSLGRRLPEKECRTRIQRWRA